MKSYADALPSAHAGMPTMRRILGRKLAEAQYDEARIMAMSDLAEYTQRTSIALMNAHEAPGQTPPSGGSMILDIEHRLNFNYSGYISESSMELRVEPTSNQHQTVRSFYIAVGPVTKVFRYINWLGAPTHHFSITDYHKEIQVISRSMVETHPKHPELDVILDSVEDIPTDGPILDSLMFTDLVVDSPRLREFSPESTRRHRWGELSSKLLILSAIT